MRANYWKEDIEIAQNYLIDNGLFPEENRIVCDIYAIPDKNHQSYYAVMHESEGEFKLTYALPQVLDVRIPHLIKMYNFGNAIHAYKHPVYEGEILTGQIALPKAFVAKVMKLLVKMPNNPQVEDAVQVIRGYEEGRPTKTYAYYSSKDKEFDEFYLEVENILTL